MSCTPTSPTGSATSSTRSQVGAARAAEPLRAPPPGRADPHRHQKLGRIQGGAGKRVRDGLRQHYNPRRRDPAGVDRNTVGWEFVHIAIDDTTRLACVEILADEKATTAIGFLRRALALYRRHHITAQRVMTDRAPREPHARFALTASGTLFAAGSWLIRGGYSTAPRFGAPPKVLVPSDDPQASTNGNACRERLAVGGKPLTGALAQRLYTETYDTIRRAIAIIDPASGRVRRTLNLKALPEDVLVTPP